MKFIGELSVPGDKSISHRSVILGSLSKGTLNVKNFLFSEDTIRTIDAFKSLGVSIEFNKVNNTVKIIGNGKNEFAVNTDNKEIYCGNSGTTARLLAGCFSGLNINCILTGDDSLSKRPMKRVVSPLSLMNAKIKNDYLPVKIKKSNLIGITYNSPVASAQVKSAILLAGINAKGTTTVIEPEKSRDHTERMIKFLNGKISVNNNTVSVFEDTFLKSNTEVFVPSDISSAAFFIVGALLIKGSELVLKNITLNETRTGLITVLKNMGASISITNKRVLNNEDVGDVVVKSSQLKGTLIDGKLIPKLIDEIPIISVAAMFATGKTVIKDAAELRVKETDRIKAVFNELSKVSNGIVEKKDGLEISGAQLKNKLSSKTFDSYKDHRIAMSLEILKNVLQEDFIINDKESVNISYPTFFDDLKKSLK